MNHPRIARALRITWTVACGLSAALLVVSWTQSYSHLTTIQIAVTTSARYYLHSYSGTLAMQVWERSFVGFELMPTFRESDLASWLTPKAGFKVVRSSGSGIFCDKF